MKSGYLLLTWLLLCSLCSCQSSSNQQPSATQQSTSDTDGTQLSREEASEAQEIWLFVGDSLTSGYGLTADQSYVAILQDLINQGSWIDSERQVPPLLKNAGVSGDTSAGALRRISWLLADQPLRVFLCIGANDGMRGQPIEAMKQNIHQIIEKVKSRGAQIHLMQMYLPPNYGSEYTKSFAQSFSEVAQATSLDLFPFLLRNVAGEAKLNLNDGIHPNQAGHQLIAEQLLEHLVSARILVKNSSTSTPLPIAPKK